MWNITRVIMLLVNFGGLSGFITRVIEIVKKFRTEEIHIVRRGFLTSENELPLYCEGGIRTTNVRVLFWLLRNLNLI